MITVTMSGSIPRGLTHVRITRAVSEAFRAARRPSRGVLGIRFVSEREITGLNRRYRHINRATDVLSFSPQTIVHPGSASEKDWGDLVVAPAFARREAKRRDMSVQEEIIRLVAHGTLHLLGYDHATQTQETRMFRFQEMVVERTMEKV